MSIENYLQIITHDDTLIYEIYIGGISLCQEVENLLLWMNN